MHISIPFPELGFISTKLLDNNGIFSLLILTAKKRLRNYFNSILIVHLLKEWTKKMDNLVPAFVIKLSNSKKS